MKTLAILCVLVCATICTSCNFSAGKKKDFSTGLAVSNSGLSLEESYLVDADNKIKNDNEVNFNTKVAIVLEGVSNYTLKDGKAFPGLMLSVTDKEGNAVIDEADLFANSEGYPPESASVVRGSVTIGTPMRAGETYHMKMRVWDHNKPENEILAELDLLIL